jgi:asparagine synthase (glutamine-hydrolysing)
MGKCRRVSGEKMSNTDNMRALAVISTSLLHAMFIQGDGGSDGEKPAEPIAVYDMIEKPEGT